jgi:hypothetical protein
MKLDEVQWWACKRAVHIDDMINSGAEANTVNKYS